VEPAVGQVVALQAVVVVRPVVVVADVATLVGFQVSLGCRNPKSEMTLRVFSIENPLVSPLADDLVIDLDLDFSRVISLIV